MTMAGTLSRENSSWSTPTNLLRRSDLRLGDIVVHNSPNLKTFNR